MAEAGSVTIRAILDASGVERGRKQVESELKGLGKGSFDGLDEGAEEAAESVKQVGDESEKAAPKIKETEKAASRAGDALTMGLATAAAAAGAAVFATAADYDAAQHKIQASLGVSSDEAERFRDIGAGIYKAGWGQSLDQVTDALIQTKETIRDIDEQGLESVTKNALALSDVFGADVNETIRGTNALMEGFGLTAEEASDLMAAGMQRGLNYTDELGDNLSEYAGRWGDAGMTASQYFSLLEAGTANGAYNLDKVGDFLNEFLTSLSDGRMEENIGRLSSGTQEVFENFKAGKATAEDVLNAVISDMRGMTDETERASIASDLWSSLGEDNAMKMILAMGDVEDTFGNVSGASEQVAEDMEQSFSQKARSAVRTLAGSLEGLGDPMLNIAEYVSDLIKGFAEWFDGLGEGGQRAVVTLAAVAAAAVPVSKGVNAVRDAAKTAGGVIGAASEALGSLAEGLGLASKGSDKAKESFDLIKVAMSPMGLMVTTLAAGFAAIGIAAIGAAEDQAELEKATTGLRDIVNGTSDAIKPVSSDIEGYGATAGSSAKSVDELREAQAKWADELAGRESELKGTVGTLDGYRATIEELAGKTSLTTTEQAKLQSALDGVNDACGTSYEVAADAGGGYQIMSDGAAVAADEIYKLIDAQKEQARVEAYQESYSEAMQQEADTAERLAEATRRQAEAQQKFNDAAAAGWSTDALQQYQYELDQANAELDEAKGLHDAAADALSGYEEKMNIAQIALQGLDDGYASIISNSSLLTSTLMQNSQSLTDFRDDLEATGVSTEALASLTDEQLAELGSSYDGTIQSISDLLDEYDEGLSETAENAMAAIDGAFGYSGEQLAGLAEQFGLSGSASMTAFATAVQEGTEPALAALSVVTGGSVQQFQDVATQAGIKSGEGMTAYALAIQAGYEPTWAALSALTGMQAQELQNAATNAGVSSQDGMNRYVSAIQAGYDPSWAALSAITGMEAQQLQDAATNAGVSGQDAMSRYVSAINAGYSPTLSAAAAIKGVTVEELVQAANEAGYKGGEAVDNFAQGVIDGKWDVESNAESVADSAQSGISSQNDSASTSGSHFASNFGSGISSMIDWVAQQARNVANAVGSILHFSVPKEGPWSGAERGGERSGEHLVQNIARGVLNAAPQIAAASSYAANLAFEGLAMANDKEGWVIPTGAVAYDVSGGGSTTNNSRSVTVNITMNATVREEADIERISRKLAQEVRRAERK